MKNLKLGYGTSVVILPWNGFFINVTELYFKAHKAALEAVGSSKSENWSIENTNELRKLSPTEVWQLPLWEGKVEVAKKAYYKTYNELSQKITLNNDAVDFLKKLMEKSEKFGFGIIIFSRKNINILEKEVSKFEVINNMRGILSEGGLYLSSAEPSAKNLKKDIETWDEDDVIMISHEHDRELSSIVGVDTFICLSDKINAKTLLKDIS